MNSRTEKPPLGIEPEWIWRTKRIANLCDAIKRYNEVNLITPPDWTDELRVHIKVMNEYYLWKANSPNCGLKT